MLVLPDYRYFLTSTSDGNIFVWKLVETGKTETIRRLIHIFEGHYRSVTSMCQHAEFPHLIVTASLDSTVRVWSLQTFQHQYTLELPTGLRLAQVYNGARNVMVGLH